LAGFVNLPIAVQTIQNAFQITVLTRKMGALLVLLFDQSGQQCQAQPDVFISEFAEH